jgi:hypothetical protein
VLANEPTNVWAAEAITMSVGVSLWMSLGHAQSLRTLT